MLKFAISPQSVELLTSDKICHSDDDSIAIEFKNILLDALDRRRHLFPDLVENVYESALGVGRDADDVTGKGSFASRDQGVTRVHVQPVFQRVFMKSILNVSD